MVLRRVERRPGEADPDVVFWCPGCKCGHAVWINQPNKRTGATWSWNGSMDKPTFSPSILIQQGASTCHLFVTDGKLHYCPDCTHQYAGQVLDMVNMDADEDAR
jgi:hypothetical protein